MTSKFSYIHARFNQPASAVCPPKKVIFVSNLSTAVQRISAFATALQISSSVAFQGRLFLCSSLFTKAFWTLDRVASSLQGFHLTIQVAPTFVGVLRFVDEGCYLEGQPEGNIDHLNERCGNFELIALCSGKAGLLSQGSMIKTVSRCPANTTFQETKVGLKS